MSSQVVPNTNVSKRVLVVEDEIAVRFPLAEHLRSAGFVVSEAWNADEATLLLASASFDAVITDFQMPGRLNGLALADTIRVAHPHTLIVLVSGVDLSRQLDSTGFTFFQKPYRGEAIVDFLSSKLFAT